ncbi:MAG: TRAP transporter small permease [Proteobacteria bacterium]|nr:TRAP transporter small permease [Pseudomonadota bacterium]
MKQLLKAIDRINDAFAYLAAFILAAIVLLILFEIFLWNAFEVSTIIADEYSAYGLAALVFLGAGYTLRKDGHIRITLIVNHVPPGFSSFLKKLAPTVSTIFMAYLLYYLYRMIAATFRYETTSGTLTETPIWIPQAIMFVGAVAFFLQLVAVTIRAYMDENEGTAG